MFGNSDLQQYFRDKSSDGVESAVERFVDSRLRRHFSRQETPLVFVKDPSQPLFYGRVREFVIRHSATDGTLPVEVGGTTRRVRVEDGKESFVTFHPIPERDMFVVPAVEMVVSDAMPIAFVNPYGC